MVGRGRKAQPGGSGQSAGTVATVGPTTAWGFSSLSRRRCSHLAAGEPAQFLGVGGDVQDHGGTDGLAEKGEDVERLKNAAQSCVITCQT